MTAAEWPHLPQAGVSLWHVSDTHFKDDGKFPWQYGHADSIALDMATPAMSRIDGRVHTGDVIAGPHNGTYPDARAKAWLEANLGGAQDVWVPGNHDVVNVNGSGNGPDRTKEDWAAVYGRSALSSTPITGPDGTTVRVLGFTADNTLFGSGPTWTMSQATLDWIDAELTANPEPTFLACHYYLPDQGNYDLTTKAQPRQDFIDLISAHSHVAGWLSGHGHWGPDTWKSVTSLAIGNRTAFPAISAPSAMITYGIGNDAPGRSCAMAISFLDYDRIEVRFRNHTAQKWVAGNDGNRLRVLSST